MKKLTRSPVMTGILFILAVVLLFAGTVGGTQAALNAPSEDYISAFDLKHIGITLYENGDVVSSRNYNDEAESLGTLKFGVTASDFLVGKTYPMALQVKNTGEIPTYIRLIVRKYWTNTTEAKITDSNYNVEFIELGYTESLSNSSNAGNWVKDSTTRSAECEVYYYTEIVPSLGTVDFTEYNTLRISPDVTKLYVKNTDGKYVYAYDGLGFVVEVEVDAIQTHNAIDAITSAWGQTAANIMKSAGVSND